MEETTDAASPQQRVVSIDVLRGLTILLMIFVNDIAGVEGTPSWLKHFEPFDGNGMTVVDVVFPAFLFIVGLAIPLAFRSREGTGEPTQTRVLHVLTRALSLLIIGVLMVNSDVVSPDGLIKPSLWTLLMYIGVFLVWVRWPHRTPHDEQVQRWLRSAGLLLLVVVAVIYRGEGVSGWMQLRPHWWGILGLIGWAYLVATLIYITARGNPKAILAGSAVLFGFFIAVEAGLLPPLGHVEAFAGISYTLGSHAALVLLGAFMGRIFLPESPVRTHSQRAAWGLLYAAGLAVAGGLLYLPHERFPYLIVNKNMGTAPWCLLSAAITAATLIVVYWLVDRKTGGARHGIVGFAGKNALLAYILAPVVYAAFAFIADLTGTTDVLTLLAEPFTVGLGRAIALSFIVTGLAALLSRHRIFLKI